MSLKCLNTSCAHVPVDGEVGSERVKASFADKLL